MAEREILLLGDEKLYQKCAEIGEGKLDKAVQVVQDLHDTLMAFKKSRFWMSDCSASNRRALSNNL